MGDLATLSDWLPQSALDDGALDQELLDIVRNWTHAWLGPNAGILSLDHETPDGGDTVSDVVSSGSDERALFIAACLKAKPADIAMTTEDEAAVERLMDAALSDLEGTLLPDQDRRGDTTSIVPFRAYKVRLDDKPILKIHLTKSQACNLRKQRIANDSVAYPLQSFRQAMGAKRCRLAAHVGTVSLDVKTLTGLSKGDVFTLPRRLDEAFDLTADGHVCEDIAARFIVTQGNDEETGNAGLMLE